MKHIAGNKRCIVLLYITMLFSGILFCQNKIIQPVPNSFVKDDSLKITVWNPRENLVVDAQKITFKLPENSKEIATHILDEHIDTVPYNLKMRMRTETTVTHLYTTKYPIIHIKTTTSILDHEKTSATLTYYGKDTTFVNPIGIEHRGNISLSFPKKSYDIEFREDMYGEKSKNIQLKGLRKDDDYVLDALYNEPLRMRAFMAQNLWLDIHKPHYAKEEPKAQSGVDAAYVEVFVDYNYKGIYLLSEQVDRKLLKLKKKKKDTVKGELFKAGYHRTATKFMEAPSFKNALPTWGGFVMKYPYEDYTSHWDDIYNTLDFTINSTPEIFANEIASHFNVNNLIDYYLFINLVRGTDNLSKNYYLARYDVDTPYFIVPWDLDGTWGVVIDGRSMNITTDILTNGLFERLWNENPNEYQAKVIDRWKTLRASHFSTETLIKRIQKRYHTFKGNHIYEREALLWKNTFTKEQLDYMIQWLLKRLEFLDKTFSGDKG